MGRCGNTTSEVFVFARPRSYHVAGFEVLIWLLWRSWQRVGLIIPRSRVRSSPGADYFFVSAIATFFFAPAAQRRRTSRALRGPPALVQKNRSGQAAAARAEGRRRISGVLAQLEARVLSKDEVLGSKPRYSSSSHGLVGYDARLTREKSRVQVSVRIHMRR